MEEDVARLVLTTLFPKTTIETTQQRLNTQERKQEYLPEVFFIRHKLIKESVPTGLIEVVKVDYHSALIIMNYI